MLKLILRICLSPIAFAWGVFVTMAGMLFPIPLIMMASSAALLLQPFVYLLNLGGANIIPIEPFLFEDNPIFGHIVCLTLPLWFPFYLTILYVKEGVFWTGDS